jgi:predicted SAM-dependent methyltransferase
MISTNDTITLSTNFKKYNLGCGTYLYENFLNIGYWSHLSEDVVYKDLNGTSNTFMLNHDLRNGIPAPDSSLDLVYHAHMLEHLSYVDGITFINECFRVLDSGGRMRVLVPDLELWINAYISKNSFFFNEYRKVLDNDIYVTNGSIFMGMLHNHEHKCGYDFEMISWLLTRCGFQNISRTLYADSTIENINLIEPMSPLRIMESLCVECTKP